MKFAGLAKTSTIDFPQRLAAVVFVAGCNYDCWFCHNRALLDGQAHLDADALWAFLEKRRGLLEGIVVSGGEPTLQDGLAEFVRRLRELDYAVKLDTNGSRPRVIETLLDEGLLDYLALDYKAPLSDYERICGRSADGVRESIDLLSTHEQAPAWELRTTVLPEFDSDTLIRMALEVGQAPLYVLQAYRDIFDERRPPRVSQSQLETYAKAIACYQPRVVLR